MFEVFCIEFGCVCVCIHVLQHCSLVFLYDVLSVVVFRECAVKGAMCVCVSEGGNVFVCVCEAMCVCVFVREARCVRS